MARLVNRLQRCKSAYSSGRFWKLSSKTQFPIEVSLNQSLQLFTISFRFDNFGCLYYYHKDRCPPPLHVTEGEGALKENEATHEAKMNHV